MTRNIGLLQAKARKMQVRRERANWFKVTNPESGRTYNVNLGENGGTCTCEYGLHRESPDRRSGCSHVIAAVAFKTGRRVKVFESVMAARKDKHAVLNIGDSLVLSLR